jgi:hypothetical protein
MKTKQTIYHVRGSVDPELLDLIRSNQGRDPWAMLLEATKLLRVWGQAEGPDPLTETRDFLISYDPETNK